MVKLAALFSGGKDSTYAIYVMEQMGHEVEVLVGIQPTNADSWMFHTPNTHLLPLMAEAIGKPLVTGRSDGTEADDLRVLSDILSNLDVEGVITGAIASDYQWDRINGVCYEMDLPVFSPLWRKDQMMLMNDMISAGFDIMIVRVSAEGLGEEWLGRRFGQAMLGDLVKLEERYGINLSGEGGEFETIVLDSPLHVSPIIIEEYEREVDRYGGTYIIKEASLGVRG